ncbi:CbtA family protein [Halomarina ordinaria]|uniref:CbtA family protein n=1 Tax=Halomarina ordinaria TaxID=3033939 RepID=A0ABD5UAF2_9EURY|nr:CbtA family protein [Halomarina sp. PSRA2]
MFFAYLRRGVTAGVVAGLAFGLLLALVANPFVAFADELGHGEGHAVDHGHGHDDAAADHGHDHHGSAVSSAVTNGVSVVSGVLWGVLLGGVVFGIAFSLLEPAIPGVGATKSYVLAAAGFVTVSGAPWLVLPPVPPGAEQALPPDTRLVVYGGMMVAGGLVCLLAGVAYERLRAARGRGAGAVAALLSLSVLAVPVLLSPVPSGGSSLPSDLATGLTGMVVFGQALLWVLLAGTHARLHRRSMDGRATGDATARADPVGAD